VSRSAGSALVVGARSEQRVRLGLDVGPHVRHREIEVLARVLDVGSGRQLAVRPAELDQAADHRIEGVDQGRPAIDLVGGSPAQVDHVDLVAVGGQAPLGRAIDAQRDLGADVLAPADGGGDSEARVELVALPKEIGHQLRVGAVLLGLLLHGGLTFATAEAFAQPFPEPSSPGLVLQLGPSLVAPADPDRLLGPTTLGLSGAASIGWRAGTAHAWDLGLRAESAPRGHVLGLEAGVRVGLDAGGLDTAPVWLRGVFFGGHRRSEQGAGVHARAGLGVGLGGALLGGMAGLELVAWGALFQPFAAGVSLSLLLGVFERGRPATG
jgi:hypothetical protein